MNKDSEINGKDWTGKKGIRKVILEVGIRLAKVKDETFLDINRKLPAVTPGINSINQFEKKGRQKLSQQCGGLLCRQQRVRWNTGKNLEE